MVVRSVVAECAHLHNSSSLTSVDDPDLTADRLDGASFAATTVSFAERETGGRILGTRLRISPHLRLLRREDGSWLAFHALFGNAATIDHELADTMIGLQDRLATPADLDATFGAAVTKGLRDAYYVVEEQEERGIVETWLAERAKAVTSGRLLGGLQITSSNACNFACSYCFADSSDRRSPARQAGAATPNISFETASRAIDRVLETARVHGRKRIGVKFLGREPFVNFKVIDRLFDRYPVEEVAWSITTNGSLVTPAIAARLADVDARLVVSIDGLAETNDAVRLVKAKQGERSAYKLAMRGLNALLSGGVATSVSAVVSAKTDFAAMPVFLEVLRDAGCREVELTLAMQTDELQAQATARDTAALVAALVALYRQATDLSLFVSGDWIDPYHAILANHKFRDEAGITRPGGAGCQATEHQISVEPNGDLFPCRAMSLHYGTLDDWGAVLAGEAYRSVAMRTYYAVPYCRGCPLEGHCQGTCLGSLEEASGDIYSPQEGYCEVYRGVAEALLRTVGEPAT